ncbi:hypothetical protein [Pseudomonas sp.]|uniref:hypothetical protein n=1 Tax=Pseudomonas sp. TaxID=306 RepID=UPI003FD7033D
MGAIGFMVVTVVGRLVTLGLAAYIVLGLFGFDTFKQLWRSGFLTILGAAVATWFLYFVFQMLGAALARAFRRG